MPAPSILKSRCRAALLALAALVLSGCGTTRSTDTSRTATEQLLISDAIDRAVQTVNLQSLAGQSVYLDDSRLGDVVDRNYLVSTLRQHLLASGCALRAERDQADFVVEARAGAIGTDRNDLLFGIPSMNVPQILPVQPVAAAIPEVPFAKRRDQRGIAKIAVFAYHRESGTPVWQSGVAHQESSANDVWILGAGPFQRGTIYDGTAFAGKTLGTDEEEGAGRLGRKPPVDLAQESTFTPPQQFAKQAVPAPTQEQQVISAVYEEPVAAADPNAPAPVAPDGAQPMQQPPLGHSDVPRSSPAPVAAHGEDPNHRLRQLMSAVPLNPAGQQNGFSVRVDEQRVTGQTQSLDRRSLYLPVPPSVDPVPLPQPRFDSP